MRPVVLGDIDQLIEMLLYRLLDDVGAGSCTLCLAIGPLSQHASTMRT
jgi:hypothetical protein